MIKKKLKEKLKIFHYVDSRLNSFFFVPGKNLLKCENFAKNLILFYFFYAEEKSSAAKETKKK